MVSSIRIGGRTEAELTHCIGPMYQKADGLLAKVKSAAVYAFEYLVVTLRRLYYAVVDQRLYNDKGITNLLDETRSRLQKSEPKDSNYEEVMRVVDRLSQKLKGAPAVEMGDRVSLKEESLGTTIKQNDPKRSVLGTTRDLSKTANNVNSPQSGDSSLAAPQERQAPNKDNPKVESGAQERKIKIVTPQPPPQAPLVAPVAPVVTQPPSVTPLPPPSTPLPPPSTPFLPPSTHSPEKVSEEEKKKIDFIKNKLGPCIYNEMTTIHAQRQGAREILRSEHMPKEVAGQIAVGLASDVGLTTYVEQYRTAEDKDVGFGMCNRAAENLYQLALVSQLPKWVDQYPKLKELLEEKGGQASLESSLSQKLVVSSPPIISSSPLPIPPLPSSPVVLPPPLSFAPPSSAPVLPPRVLSPEEEFRLSEQQLSQGVHISEDIKSDVDKVFNNQAVQCSRLSSSKNSFVFVLKSYPDLIFKTSAAAVETHMTFDDALIKQRYANMVNAQTVIRNNKLDLLVIPNAVLFTVNTAKGLVSVIAEKKLDITDVRDIDDIGRESYVTEHILNQEKKLEETVRQMTVFAYKTGYGDIEWRNNPILKADVDSKGNRKLALIDLEDMSQAEKHRMDSFITSRLLKWVTEPLGKTIIATANKEGGHPEGMFEYLKVLDLWGTREKSRKVHVRN